MDISLCLKRPASTQPHPPFDNDHYLLLSYANKDIFGDCPPPPFHYFDSTRNSELKECKLEG